MLKVLFCAGESKVTGGSLAELVTALWWLVAGGLLGRAESGGQEDRMGSLEGGREAGNGYLDISPSLPIIQPGTFVTLDNLTSTGNLIIIWFTIVA